MTRSHNLRTDREAPGAAADDALADAFAAREPEIRRIAAKAGPDEAGDVVQDALLKALEAGRAKPVSNPTHFLARIARNTVIDRLRGRARRSLLFAGGVEADPADPAANPERSLVATERLRRALEVIDRMPPKRRQVFLLHRFDELGYAEIARRLGISTKMVEKHMAQAMIQLDREVDGE